ncbi:helix-turn-helix domain-containing protein [Haloprofundus halophilus]|uniref:helix-turn-helix domain-containing protein n=1 Tax=Haloprofundus halophilus TaxID=2283527 RepID=UPI000E43C316|nr:helix-turn-helix domain-containing protein [Haloprofundus halophilus]
MTTIAELRTPAEQFALGTLFERHSEVSTDVLRTAADGQKTPASLLWFNHDGSVDLESALDRDSSVETATLLAESNGKWLYQITWTPSVRDTLETLLGCATLLGASAENGRWQFRVLFPRHEQLATAHDRWESNDLQITVERITELDETFGDSEFALTDEQKEAFVIAHRRGYFKVPRDVTLTELADEIGITQQALSERLRRAHNSLAESTLHLTELTEDEVEPLG